MPQLPEDIKTDVARRAVARRTKRRKGSVSADARPSDSPASSQPAQVQDAATALTSFSPGGFVMPMPVAGFQPSGGFVMQMPPQAPADAQQLGGPSTQPVDRGRSRDNTAPQQVGPPQRQPDPAQQPVQRPENDVVLAQLQDPRIRELLGGLFRRRPGLLQRARRSQNPAHFINALIRNVERQRMLDEEFLR